MLSGAGGACPPGQSIKTRVEAQHIYCFRMGLESPPGQSIKTRVEAGTFTSSGTSDTVRLDNPLKQGLKPVRKSRGSPCTLVRLDNPLKQGLKQVSAELKDGRAESAWTIH